MTRTARYLLAAAVSLATVGCAKHVHVHDRGPRRVVVHERPVVVHEERVVVRESPARTHIHVDADRHDRGRHRGHKDKDRVHVNIDARY